MSRRVVIGGLAATLFRLRSSQATPTAGEKVTILEAAPGRLALRRGTPTEVWTYNGGVPGPFIRIAKSEEVRVRLVNKLAQPTTLCWHGVRIANAMDGVGGLTQAPVPPGGTFDYRFTPPDAGLYWYHPHTGPYSEEQIVRGLYGLLIVDDPAPPPVDQDLVLVIDDWPLDPTGRIAIASRGSADDALVTVNSKPAPDGPVTVPPGARLRFRLCNVSASRIAIVTFAGMTASVVAIDGQPSELFPPAGGTVPLGPGARFEILADITGDKAAPPVISLRTTDGKPRPLMTFAVAGKAAASRPPIAALRPNPLLPTRIPLEKAIKPKLEIAAAATGGAKAPGAPAAAWSLGGVTQTSFAPSPLFKVKRGGAVSLALVNTTTEVQQMHVHGHVFRVLHDLDDGWDPYWRDSILIAPGRTKHIAFIADNPGRWVIESLMLDRQVRGLAGWFEVSER